MEVHPEISRLRGRKAKARFIGTMAFFIQTIGKPPYTSRSKKVKERDQKYPLSALSFLNGSIRIRAIKKNISLLPEKNKTKIQKIGNTKLLVSPSLLES